MSRQLPLQAPGVWQRGRAAHQAPCSLALGLGAHSSLNTAVTCPVHLGSPCAPPPATNGAPQPPEKAPRHPRGAATSEGGQGHVQQLKSLARGLDESPHRAPCTAADKLWCLKHCSYLRAHVDVT